MQYMNAVIGIHDEIRKTNERGVDWDALRNQAAVAAMQGLLSNASLVDPAWDYRVNVEKTAVACADSLIAELKKEAKAELSQAVTKSGDKEWSKQDELFLQVCKNALAKYQKTDQWDSNIISQWLEEKLKQ